MPTTSVDTFDNIPEEMLAGRCSSMSHYSSISATTGTTTTEYVTKTKPKKRVVYKRKVRNMEKHHLHLKRKYSLAKNLNTIANFQKILKNMTTKTAKFIKIRESGKQTKGRRFTFDEKVFSLCLYKQGPKGYRYYQQFFALPSSSTLLKLLESHLYMQKLRGT